MEFVEPYTTLHLFIILGFGVISDVHAWRNSENFELCSHSGWLTNQISASRLTDHSYADVRCDLSGPFRFSFSYC